MIISPLARCRRTRIDRRLRIRTMTGHIFVQDRVNYWLLRLPRTCTHCSNSRITALLRRSV